MDDSTTPSDVALHVESAEDDATLPEPATTVEADLSDEPTLAQEPRSGSIEPMLRSFASSTALAVRNVASGAAPALRSFANGAQRGFLRGVRRVRRVRLGGRRRGALIALISLGLLLILAIPLAMEAVNAAHDYTTLKGLGQSGLTHLLAVKDDLTGQSGSASSSSSSSSSSSLAALGGSGKSAALLASVQAMLAAPGLAVKDPAYTYLAQRQSGTFYPLTVTVQPAKGVSAEGSKTATFKTTLATNTYFTVGGQPIATPTATPASTPGTPSATKPTATPTAQHPAARVAASQV